MIGLRRGLHHQQPSRNSDVAEATLRDVREALGLFVLHWPGGIAADAKDECCLRQQGMTSGWEPRAG
ncbi:hypothetical protein [Bradyrhizobium aeschynomenes]|uniref:hypothetical protein n=1 Tax=Bradyrhizobium aeschynomenes TaxID=2734909 RepID=UPI001551DF1F|nr:hypothetical protein [Bradyrhizobium aeschynomenes]NPV21764.1 hypothetical protein [Bradyrhizobium aeschynomenes]